MEHLLPDVAETLQEYVDSLPNNEIAPMEPFSSLVINLNCMTAIHRDWNDWHVCGVLVISECIGGATSFYEYGLSIKGRNGDYMLFKSHKVSHLNQPFDGLRASLVFHADKEAESWIKEKFNGWADNMYFVNLNA